jgi:transketolase
MAEGSMWEAFQHAGWEGLDNLVAIVDVNRLGQTREAMLGWDMDGYAERVSAFRVAHDRDRRPRRGRDRGRLRGG